MRTFLCLEMSSAVRDELATLQERLRRRGFDLAYTKPADAHLTLVFLGDVSPELAEGLIPRLDQTLTGRAPFVLSMGGGGFFGPPRSPKVIWIGIRESDELMLLQKAAQRAVVEAGVGVEARPFHPHLTVARIRARLPSGALTTIKSCINNIAFSEVPVHRVLFMHSQLNGAGPRYRLLHEVILKGT